jgi:hypothetical protein
MTKLETQAAALVAANRAKYKAEGKTQRVELDIFGPRGAYLKTSVFYTEGDVDTARIARMALKAGTKSISLSIESAKVSAL